MKLISIPGIVAAASLALAPAAFAGSPDHGPHVVPNVHDASTHTGPTPKVNHEGHEGDHHGTSGSSSGSGQEGGDGSDGGSGGGDD